MLTQLRQCLILLNGMGDQNNFDFTKLIFRKYKKSVSVAQNDQNAIYIMKDVDSVSIRNKLYLPIISMLFEVSHEKRDHIIVQF